MNILVIPSWLGDKNSTLGSFFVEQAEALAGDENNNVYVVFSHTFSLKRVIRYRKTDSNSIFVKNKVNYFINKGLYLWKYSLFLNQRSVFVDKIVEEFKKIIDLGVKIDIIHAHSCFWASLAAEKLNKEYGIPYVVTEHSTIYALKRTYVKGKIYRDICNSLNNSSTVICVGNDLKRRMEGLFDINNIIVLGNVVDTEKFRITSAETEESKPFTFFTVFYMNSKKQIMKKGADLLIEAFSKVLEKDSNIELIIGGEGRKQASLKKMCIANEVDSKVHFVGGLSRDEVVTYMNKCDAFILPSRYETFGVSYIEAMACGKPVIATPNGGAEDIVNNNNGIMCNEISVQSITKAMIEMLDSYNMFDSDQIRSNVRRQYSKCAISEKLKIIYLGVLNNKG